MPVGSDLDVSRKVSAAICIHPSRSASTQMTVKFQHGFGEHIQIIAQRIVHWPCVRILGAYFVFLNFILTCVSQEIVCLGLACAT